MRGDTMIEEMYSRTLILRARFAVLVRMFAIAIGYGIVLPILPFLVERLARTADPAALSRHTGLLNGTYAIALFLFAPLWGRISDRHLRSHLRPRSFGGMAGHRFALINVVILLNAGFAAATVIVMLDVAASLGLPRLLGTVISRAD